MLSTDRHICEELLPVLTMIGSVSMKEKRNSNVTDTFTVCIKAVMCFAAEFKVQNIRFVVKIFTATLCKD